MDTSALNKLFQEMILKFDDERLVKMLDSDREGYTEDTAALVRAELESRGVNIFDFKLQKIGIELKIGHLIDQTVTHGTNAWNDPVLVTTKTFNAKNYTFPLPECENKIVLLECRQCSGKIKVELYPYQKGIERFQKSVKTNYIIGSIGMICFIYFLASLLFKIDDSGLKFLILLIGLFLSWLSLSSLKTDRERKSTFFFENIEESKGHTLLFTPNNKIN